MTEVEELREQLQKALEERDAVHARCKQAEEEASIAKGECSRLKEKQQETPSPLAREEHLVYVSSGRKLDRFRDRPEKPSDPTVDEWVADVRGQLATRKLNSNQQTAFIIEHLAGKARQEILGRGFDTASKPEDVLTVLLKVFGDGCTLPQLQQMFFGYKQHSDEDLLTCSLKLVDLFDRIVVLDPSFKNCREATLKGRLAEAVQDESLQREIRRLTNDCEKLTFFELRDRAQQWLGTAKPKVVKVKELAIQEAATRDGILSEIRKQGQQIALQQQQIGRILSDLSSSSGAGKLESGSREPSRRKNSHLKKACWHCGSPDHLRNKCPSYNNNQCTDVTVQALN